MEKTYVVYSEEYYFSMNVLSTVLRKKVYNVSYNQESAEEVKTMMEEVLKKSVEAAEVNANNEMLTAYKIEIVCLDKRLSIEEAKSAVIDDDYTWGRIRKSR